VERARALRVRDAILDPRLVVISLAILTAVLVPLVLHTALGLELSVVALLGDMLLLALFSRLVTANG
jgi:Na+/H+ antiporter NhaD/arsenite permease-like protein